MVWSVEQVESVAPSAAAITAAQPVATPARWLGSGADERMLWGSFQGGGAEPYDTVVDHVDPGFRCTCPSRKTPCKHALGLLLMWTRGQVPGAVPPPVAEDWIRRRTRSGESAGPETDSRSDSSSPGSDSDTTAATSEGHEADPPEPPSDADRDAARDERVERMMAGLVELDRWLDDRIRTGLSDPALARYATWDDLAARLVDAQAGSLANRVRRLAGIVGASPGWHDDVLHELGLLHLLSQAGRRLGELPGSLADAVATTVGWQVRKADVLGGVPDTDRWVVAGRSDQREDRIEVRRHWLRGEESGRWALVLSFAAYQQSLDDSLIVGSRIHADLHRYPGPALRALVGRRHADETASMFPGQQASPDRGRPPGQSVAEALDEVGSMLVAEPWLDRLPTSLTAAVVRRDGRWCLGDHTGTIPVAPPPSPHRRRAEDEAVTMVLALSAGRPVDMTVEWTPQGVIPLAVHLDDRSVDIGPRADPSFVEAS